MKAAVCSKCGKATGGMVPDDATHITCFACDNNLCKHGFSAPAICPVCSHFKKVKQDNG